jgi:D-alanine--poly(phosphoribitol) ligase subunit 2
MSMNGRVNEEVRAIFAEALNVVVPSDEIDLIEGGLLDSLALVELIVEIEHRFGMSIPFDTLDIDDFRTVRSIGAVVSANSERSP